MWPQRNVRNDDFVSENDFGQFSGRRSSGTNLIKLFFPVLGATSIGRLPFGRQALDSQALDRQAFGRQALDRLIIKGHHDTA
jgi:hypothetical protein